MLRGDEQRHTSGMPEAKRGLHVGSVKYLFNRHHVGLLARKQFAEIRMDLEKAFMKRLFRVCFYCAARRTRLLVV